jgi:hypothetical protein
LVVVRVLGVELATVDGLYQECKWKIVYSIKKRLTVALKWLVWAS